MHNNAALRLWGICIWNGHPVDKIENLSLYLSSGLSPVYIPESSKWQAFQLIHYNVFSTTNKKNFEKSCRKNIIWYMDHLWHLFRHFWLDPTVIYKIKTQLLKHPWSFCIDTCPQQNVACFWICDLRLQRWAIVSFLFEILLNHSFDNFELKCFSDKFRYFLSLRQL